MEQDWYLLTVAADLLAFLYVALFYQMVLQSARTLADLTEQRVIPADYLYTLIALFLCLVLDRVCYTLGHHRGKAALLAGQALAVYWYCLSLYWSPLETSAAARAHLRAFAALKSLAFVFSALQLRSGYPPPASYQGGRGRHSFVFTRSTGPVAWLGFQVFAAVPFVYELREILDWSATATTLRLFDWLKLEDINMSLYFVTVSQKSRAQRSLGQRVPRYQKLVQGAFLFVGLLVLLWVPLLIFSTGNPTFQTPGIRSFSVDVSLSSGGAPHGRAAAFPLWGGGGRRALRGALANDSVPGALEGQYAADQIQLLCVAEDADKLWQASPPASAALRQLLSSPAAELRIDWRVARTAPPPSPHGGPDCSGAVAVHLAGASRSQLLDVLDGNRSSARLMALNASDPRGADPGAPGHPGLYGLFWRFAGDACAVTPDVASLARGADGTGWDQQWVGCDAALERGGVSSAAWWRLSCGVLGADGQRSNVSDAGLRDCPKLARGPRLVGVMERVQAGLLGQTVSAFGITGLYITFVFGIGRFLRLSISNMRMRIPFDDLPNTSRLIALCQDIYIARAEGELALEEELYWALINIYRMPSVLFELTKKKED